MNRFDLEEAISEVFTTNEELETLMYKVGDSPATPSEDELINMLIGIIELNKVRYEKLWNTFEALVADGTISNKGLDNTNLPDYDDGTMAMKVTNSEGEAE
jgi:hypothetical protein